MSAISEQHRVPAWRAPSSWLRWLWRESGAPPRTPAERLSALGNDLIATALVLMVGISGLIEANGLPDPPAPWLDVASQLAIPAVAVAIPLLRRRPELLAVVSILLSTVAVTACALPLAAAYYVGLRVPPRRAGWWFAALTLPIWVNSWLWPSSGVGNYLGDVLLGTAVVVGLGAWGLYRAARGELVETLRERADRAETEQQLRIAQARQQERTRIAREMHDVLAHRMSLLSVHAGALEFRADAGPDEVARAAGVIRENAHEALEELRAVIGVLRVEDLSAATVDDVRPADGDDPRTVRAAQEVPDPPQPTLADVPALVDGWRQAGARIELTVDAETDAWQGTLGRTAYRVVQEGLTNAGRHAEGARVSVRISPAADGGLVVTVENPLPPGAATRDTHGSGLGLIGLRERAQLAGGTLTAERDEQAGRFLLRAELPGAAAA